MHRFIPALAALLLVSAPARSAPGTSATAGRDAHGGFTGQIKAVIYVADVEASAPFYRDALGFGFHGFAEHEGAPYYAELDAGGVKFGLHEAMSEAQAPKIGRQRLYFRVEDLDAHRARVLARGGEPGDVVETAWMDMFLVRDPDGNEIVFAATDPGRHAIDPWRTESQAAQQDREDH